MGLLSEFKTFINRGNVMDLAVGVIIGGALGTVVSSLVNDIIMPPIGPLLVKVDFSQLKWVLTEATGGDPATEVAIRWGAFINSVISFVIVAFVVWRISKMFIHEEPAAPAPEMKTCPFCQELVPAAATKCRACTSAI